MKKMLSLVVLALLCSAPKSAHATYDGTPSTGSFTVAVSTALSANLSTGTVVILDTATLNKTIVTVGAYQFVAGRDFSIGASTNATAQNLVTAINASPASFQVTATALANDNTVTLTAISSGSLYNSVATKSSNSGEVNVPYTTLQGGRDNAIVYINAIPLVQGRDWFVMDVASNTAINLAAAINHNALTANLVTAAWAGNGVVFLRSALTPVAYTLAESAGSAITLSNPTMQGGAVGNILLNGCYLGIVNTLPTANYPAGCTAYLNSDANHVYLSTQAVVGSWSWLAVSSNVPPKTKAQLAVITPNVGDIYSCTDCTLTFDIVIGTGATVQGFRETGTNHGPQ